MPKQNGFIPLVLLIPLLLISAIAISSAFYFKNYSPITKLPTANLLTPIPLPNISSSPTLSSDQTISPDLIGANRKTYTNNKFGYSIKYPSDIYVRYDCPDGELILNIRDINEKDETIKFETCAKDSLDSLQIYTQAEKIIRNPQSNKIYNIETKTIKIDNTDATQYTYSSRQDAEFCPVCPSWYSEVIISKNNKNYLLTFTDEGNKELFNQIFSTFKFLDQKQRNQWSCKNDNDCFVDEHCVSVGPRNDPNTGQIIYPETCLKKGVILPD